jgi:Tfp pilus assembly protein PilV
LAFAAGVFAAKAKARHVPHLPCSSNMQRKLSLQKVSESARKRSLPRLGLRCSEAIAEDAIRYCVSEGEKSNVSFVRIVSIDGETMKVWS